MALKILDDLGIKKDENDNTKTAHCQGKAQKEVKEKR